jgi:hypothetical protein
MKRNHFTLTSLLLAGTATLFAGCSQKDAVDEATAAGKTVADLPETRVDLFKPMDRGVALTPEEIAGRNTWMLWTGGNEAFWDYLSRNAYGLVEFLKTIDSRGRPQRFAKMGLIKPRLECLAQLGKASRRLAHLTSRCPRLRTARIRPWMAGRRE